MEDHESNKSRKGISAHIEGINFQSDWVSITVEWLIIGDNIILKS